MGVLKALAGVALWGAVLVYVYVTTVETSSGSQAPAVKRRRFVSMVLLWAVITALGAAALGSLLAGRVSDGWPLAAAIAPAIAIPWAIAIRLQTRWGRAEPRE